MPAWQDIGPGYSLLQGNDLTCAAIRHDMKGPLASWEWFVRRGDDLLARGPAEDQESAEASAVAEAKRLFQVAA